MPRLAHKLYREQKRANSYLVLPGGFHHQNILVGLLCIWFEVNSGALLAPSMFYHPGPLNTTVNDASHHFDLPDNNFFSLLWPKYCPSQSAVLWTQCHPPSIITSCVISVLCRRMSRMAMWRTPARISSMKNLDNSAPHCRSSIGSIILPTQCQISFRFTTTGSVADTGISALKSVQTWCLRRGEILPWSAFWMEALTPKNYPALPAATSTSASVASSVRTPVRTPPSPPLSRSLSPLALFWLTPKVQDISLRINAYRTWCKFVCIYA